MARSHWFVVIGPPFIVLVAGVVAAGVASRASRVNAGTLPAPRPITDCRVVADGIAGPAPTSLVGTWWRSAPDLDPAGALTGWTLTAGSTPGGMVQIHLPAASTVSGPDRGRLIVATDDGSRSSIRVIDVASGCDHDLDVGRAVARQAIADPGGDGLLVHLVARDTRADLGVWLVAPDGNRTPVVGPVDATTLGAAGIDRVWATNLVASTNGRRLAVQSCDPESCVTRVLERASGRVITLLGQQGDAIGFAADRLITMAGCHGNPCGVLAWDDVGTATVLADGTVGAAVADDGTVLVAVPQAGSVAEAIVVDPRTRGQRDVGRLAGGVVPLAANRSSSGIETGPHAVGLDGPSGPPSILDLGPAAMPAAVMPAAAMPDAVPAASPEVQP